jgi:hypothetical protein
VKTSVDLLQGVPWLAKELVAYQERLCSEQLAGWFVSTSQLTLQAFRTFCYKLHSIHSTGLSHFLLQTALNSLYRPFALSAANCTQFTLQAFRTFCCKLHSIHSTGLSHFLLQTALNIQELCCSRRFTKRDFRCNEMSVWR